MNVYIFRGDECVDTYERPDCSDIVDFLDKFWNNFGLWLFWKGYLQSPFRIEFK